MKHRKKDGENNSRIFRARFFAIRGSKIQIVSTTRVFLQSLFFTTVAAHLFHSLCYGLDRQKEACPSFPSAELPVEDGCSSEVDKTHLGTCVY